jgi:hypothetical protein
LAEGNCLRPLYFLIPYFIFPISYFPTSSVKFKDAISPIAIEANCVNTDSIQNIQSRCIEHLYCRRFQPTDYVQQQFLALAAFLADFIRY